MLNTPLVTGVDLFAQYRYLNLVKGQFIVFTAGAELQPPTLENLGQEANLFYVDDTDD